MFSKVWLASKYMWSVAYFTSRQPQVGSTHYQCFPFSQASLKPADLSAFAHVCSDPRAQHYSQVIQRRAGDFADRTRVRNHRYAALRALQRGRSNYSSMLNLYRHVALVLTVPTLQEGKYFSEEQMRSREPLLYEQYIGQYLTDEEVTCPHITLIIFFIFFTNEGIFVFFKDTGALPGSHAR